MLKRHWLKPGPVGLVLVIALVWALGAWSGSYNERQRQTNEHNTPYPVGEVSDPSAFWTGRAATTPVYERICAYPIDKDQADLCQQWHSAEAAQQVAYYTLFSVIIGAGGLFGLWRAVKWARRGADHARDSVSETRRIGEAQTRAYVAVGEVTLKFRESRVPQIIIHCHNSGQTPATFVAVAVKMTRIKENDLAITPVADAIGYDAIGPVGATCVGEYHPHSTEFGDQLGAAIRSTDRTKIFVVYGVVRYGTVFEEIYESEFMFFLPSGREGDGGNFRRAPNMFLRTYQKCGPGE